MKQETFNQVSRALMALGCVTSDNVLDIDKIEKFAENVDEFKANVQAIIDFYASNPLTKEKVIMSKQGRVYLVQSWKIGTDQENNINWHGATVMSKNGSASVLPMNDIAPFTATAKVLYGPKE